MVYLCCIFLYVSSAAPNVCRVKLPCQAALRGNIAYLVPPPQAENNVVYSILFNEPLQLDFTVNQWSVTHEGFVRLIC